MLNSVINVVIAGLGGQGVIKASDVLADAAFRAGFDVKKSEIHGMSQRGGSVSSDVRFGKGVLSPMVPVGEADFLVALDVTQVEPNRHQLREGGVVASPMREVVRLHASSGTTGKPIVVAYTQDDINVWSSVMMRSFAACGLHAGDIIQNAYGYGLFTGGLGAHYGAEALGATVIPISGGNTDRQIMVMKDFGVTAICCTPSYFIHLIERATEMGVEMKKLPLRAGVFGAEPWTEGMRKHIEANSSVKAFDIYGLSEIIGPGVGIECRHQAGLHIFEDHFLVEIVDPETDNPMPDGSEGELVLTTLSKNAMPIIRYRTHDITAIVPEPCTCGRTIRRIRRIGRRSDDMFIIRGVNVFPSQIETALLAVEGTLPHYQIVLTRAKGLDNMEVRVEVTPEVFSDKISSLEALQKKLSQAIERVINIRADVRLVEPRTIPRSEGKAKRVSDQRKM
ncbi:MAG TPA: 2-oxoacid:acceptor oxidoreductase family protein [Planctomycetota bacterium]|nr:2-oxoacid:acceptor oxidoreductase family protein [Planctomycetota bacterium]